MEKFIKAATSDLLADAVPESLKNMLLVMDTAAIFLDPTNSLPHEKPSTTPLWELTWDKLETFLPHLMPDLFGDRQRANTHGVSTTLALSPSYAYPTLQKISAEGKDPHQDANTANDSTQNLGSSNGNVGICTSNDETNAADSDTLGQGHAVPQEQQQDEQTQEKEQRLRPTRRQDLLEPVFNFQ